MVGHFARALMPIDGQPFAVGKLSNRFNGFEVVFPLGIIPVGILSIVTTAAMCHRMSKGLSFGPETQ